MEEYEKIFASIRGVFSADHLVLASKLIELVK